MRKKEAERKLAEASSNEKVPEADAAHKPSAIVALKLDKPLVRVVAESDQADAAVCDIGFSRNLVERGDDQPGYQTVAENVARGKSELNWRPILRRQARPLRFPFCITTRPWSVSCVRCIRCRRAKFSR